VLNLSDSDFSFVTCRLIFIFPQSLNKPKHLYYLIAAPAFCFCCFVFFLVQLMHVGALVFALTQSGGFTDDKLNGGRRGVTVGQMQDN